jgi:hypothetical protein
VTRTPPTPADLRAQLTAVETRIGSIELDRAYAPRWQPWAGFVTARNVGRLEARARRIRYQLRKAEELEARDG